MRSTHSHHRRWRRKLGRGLGSGRPVRSTYALTAACVPQQQRLIHSAYLVGHMYQACRIGCESKRGCAAPGTWHLKPQLRSAGTNRHMPPRLTCASLANDVLQRLQVAQRSTLKCTAVRSQAPAHSTDHDDSSTATLWLPVSWLPALWPRGRTWPQRTLAPTSHTAAPGS